MPSSTESNALSQGLTDFALKGTTFTRPANGLWVALFTTTPALDGTGGVEVSTSGTGYGRVNIADNAWTGPSGSNIEYSNTNDLTFGLPTANWGTIVSSGLYTAQTGGTLWYISSGTAPKTVNAGDGAPKILAGSYKISRAVC